MYEKYVWNIGPLIFPINAGRVLAAPIYLSQYTAVIININEMERRDKEIEISKVSDVSVDAMIGFVISFVATMILVR